MSSWLSGFWGGSEFCYMKNWLCWRFLRTDWLVVHIGSLLWGNLRPERGLFSICHMKRVFALYIAWLVMTINVCVWCHVFFCCFVSFFFFFSPSPFSLSFYCFPNLYYILFSRLLFLPLPLSFCFLPYSFRVGFMITTCVFFSLSLSSSDTRYDILCGKKGNECDTIHLRTTYKIGKSADAPEVGIW